MQRVFLGGVFCVLPDRTPNLLKLKSDNFNNLICRFGGKLSKNGSNKDDIKILFGLECFDNNCIEPVAAGWRGGINFNNQTRIELNDDENDITLGPIASASLACFFAFCKKYKIFENDFEINCGISLWDIDTKKNWYDVESDGPKRINLPRNIWNLGLGHLGQAYIWTLGLMNFQEPSKTKFLLQDADVINEENIGSQVLSFVNNIGYPKTRACMTFLEELGFKTQVIEKPYIKGDSEQEWLKYYPFLLNGVDNTQTRKGLNNKYLQLFIDGATNGSLSLFDSFTMKNVFKLNINLDDLWIESDTGAKILHKNLYDKYEKTQRCGHLTNYGISTPFIGLFSSTIIVAELLRSLNCGKIYSIISLQLRDLKNMEAIENGKYNRELLRYAI